MTFNAFVSGLYTNPDRFRECIAKIGIIGKLSELQNVLACLKCTEFTPQDSLTHCTDLLKQLDVQELDDKVRLVTKFCTEQLNLVQTHANARRYSSFLMGQCAMWDRMSPKLYEHLYNSSLMVLPHPNTCREKLNALNVTEGFSPVTKKKIEMRIKKLTEREKLVHLSMDEVHTSETFEMTAGTFFGETAGQTTKKNICYLHFKHCRQLSGSCFHEPCPYNKCTIYQRGIQQGNQYWVHSGQCVDRQSQVKPSLAQVSHRRRPRSSGTLP